MFPSAVEELQARIMPTLVFIFNGNGLAEAEPDSVHTQLRRRATGQAR